MINSGRQRQVRRYERARRIYAQLLRLYPVAQRRAFGEQMLQTFADHYRDAVEQRRREWEVRFWLSVAGDESRSLVREHLAALGARLWPLQPILAAPFAVWRQQQTRRLALLSQLCLITAVLLVWSPLLMGRVLLARASMA
jgi:hypothetical protein